MAQKGRTINYSLYVSWCVSAAGSSSNTATLTLFNSVSGAGSSSNTATLTLFKIVSAAGSNTNTAAVTLVQNTFGGGGGGAVCRF